MTSNQEPPTLGEFGGHEIYPMPVFATLAVADVAATTAWYERALGFSTVFRAPEVDGQPALVHLRRRKYQDLLLTPAPPGKWAAAPSSLTLSFNADGDVDSIAERARAIEPSGQSSITGPFNTPWNTRDVRVTDPAGHVLVFTGRNPDVDSASLARMQALLDAGRVIEKN